MAASHEQFETFARIDFSQHVSGFTSVDVTWDFPGTVTVNHPDRPVVTSLTLRAGTEPGEGRVYVNATDEDGTSLNVSIRVRVFSFRPLTPRDLRCVGQTDEGFVAVWERPSPYTHTTFPTIHRGDEVADGGYEYQVNPDGIPGWTRPPGGRFWGGPTYMPMWGATYHLAAGLKPDKKYRFLVRAYFRPISSPDYYFSHTAQVECFTKPEGHQPALPEIAHVEVFQGNLVGAFPQGGRAPRTPNTANRHSVPWRVPLVLGRKTSVAATVLFDKPDPEVRIDGESIGFTKPDIFGPSRDTNPHFDEESGRLKAIFVRTFEETPPEFVIEAGEEQEVRIHRWEMAMGTAPVPPWTAIVVPIKTPDDGEPPGIAPSAMRQGLEVWPFDEVEVELATPLESSYTCQDSSTILQEVYEQIDAPPRSTVFAVVRRGDGGSCKSFSTSDTEIGGLAYVGEPYALVVCGFGGNCPLFPRAVAHEFGHTAGLRHPHNGTADCGRIWSCTDDTYPYQAGFLAPFLDSLPHEDSSVAEEWLRAPLHLDHGTYRIRYGRIGDWYRASGTLILPTINYDVMTPNGFGKFPFSRLSTKWPSDHNYRKVLEYLRYEEPVRRTGSPIIVH